jgi:hypothetical protein
MRAQGMVFETPECSRHSLCKLVDDQLVILNVVSVLRQYQIMMKRVITYRSRTNLYGRVRVCTTCSHHSRRPFPPDCTLETLALYCLAYRGVTSRMYPSSSTAITYVMRLSTFARRDDVLTGVGSKTLRLFTKARMGSTGSQRPSGREKTSVQKTGGVVRGSEGSESHVTVCKRRL